MSSRPAGVTTEPSVMLDMVECADCHAGIGEGHSVERVREACSDCHDEEYGAILEAWQSGTRRGLDAARELLEGEDGTAGRSDGERPGMEARESRAEARAMIEGVVRDGSLGAHNPELARLLIERAMAILHRIEDGDRE